MPEADLDEGGKPGTGRRRILTTAYDLFSRSGIRAVGVDTITAKADVAKMTLYRNFRSKSELALAFLELREERWVKGWLQAETQARAATPTERLLVIFDLFTEWFEGDDFNGCPFVTSLLEFEDLGDPVRRACVEHLAGIRAYICELATGAGAADPAQLAAQWHLLLQGAIIAAHEGDLDAATKARELAVLVLEREGLAEPAGDRWAVRRRAAGQRPAAPERERGRATPAGWPGTSLRHDAFLYDCDETFVAAIGAHLETGLRAGAHAVAVTTQHNLGLLRESLGGNWDNVVCIDRDEWYEHPARVLAGFDRVVRDAEAAGAPSVYAIGEVRFGTTPREWDRWTAYEATVDHALAGCKLNVICAYDERVLPAAVLAGACTTHDHVITDARRPSPAYADAASVVRTHTPVPEPLPQLRALAPPDSTHALRQLLAAEMAATGVPDVAARDMLLAASEVFNNARQHGGGATALAVGRVGTHFVCEISDAGAGLDDPLAGYLPPRLAQRGSAGLWIARQATSAVELLRSDAGGLTVRLWS